MSVPSPSSGGGRERAILIALNADDELTRGWALRLSRARFESPAAAARTSSDAGRESVPPAAVAARLRAVTRDAWRIAAREERRAARHGASILTRLDPGFPAALADLELPPAVLYCRGELPAGPAIAIVGSRHADPYGREVATHFARRLAGAGLVVVSGFALGIDTAAHRGALAAGGRTLAVLGCGVDVRYPRANTRLAGTIAAGAGAVVSEFRMGTSPEAWRFPVRNRLIAALSAGTLVVRAAPRSGSLITARLALELGREVWAVPGNIWDKRSVGANSLIRDGAHPVQEPSEILESLPSRVQDLLPPPAGEEIEAGGPAGEPGPSRLLQLLPRGELVEQDALVAASGLPVEEVVAHLLTLELAGRLRRYPGPAYCRRG